MRTEQEQKVVDEMVETSRRHLEVRLAWERANAWKARQLGCEDAARSIEGWIDLLTWGPKRNGS